MFDRIKINFYIAIAWVVLFLMVWIIFDQFILTTDQLNEILLKIEEDIKKEDWAAASRGINNLQDMWQSKKAEIQFNNSTQVITSLERMIGELEVAIFYRNKNALRFVGGLKQDLNNISKVFPGP